VKNMDTSLDITRRAWRVGVCPVCDSDEDVVRKNVGYLEFFDCIDCKLIWIDEEDL